MLKRHVLLASLLAGTFAVTACSQQTEKQADEGNVEAAAESAGDDIKAHTENVATEAEAAAQNAADGAQTAAAVTAGAAVNAGEAIADGANAAVENTASAVAEGAANVADGAQNVANDAANQGKTDLQADPKIEEAVAEDQKY